MRYLSHRLRVAQPGRSVALNRVNPLTRGMDIAINFADGPTPVNAVTGARLQHGGAGSPSRGAGKFGRWVGVGADDDGSRWIPDQPQSAIKRSIAVYWAAPGIIGTGNRGIIAAFNDGSTGDMIHLATSWDTTIQAASSPRATAAGSTNFPDRVLSFDWADGAYKIYYDGVLSGQSTSISGNPALYGILGMANAFSQWGVPAYLWCAWTRVLTPQEHLLFALNPWQVFA